MINPSLERLKQALHDLPEGFIPAGRVRAEDVRAVIAEAKRLNERMKVLERSLVLEVGLREAARQSLEQASLAWSKLGLLGSYDRG